MIKLSINRVLKEEWPKLKIMLFVKALHKCLGRCDHNLYHKLSLCP